MLDPFSEKMKSPCLSNHIIMKHKNRQQFVWSQKKYLDRHEDKHHIAFASSAWLHDGYMMHPQAQRVIENASTNSCFTLKHERSILRSDILRSYFFLEWFYTNHSFTDPLMQYRSIKSVYHHGHKPVSNNSYFEQKVLFFFAVKQCRGKSALACRSLPVLLSLSLLVEEQKWWSLGMVRES